MKRMKIEIMGISEMRWPGSGDIEYSIQAQ